MTVCGFILHSSSDNVRLEYLKTAKVTHSIKAERNKTAFVYSWYSYVCRKPLKAASRTNKLIYQS